MRSGGSLGPPSGPRQRVDRAVVEWRESARRLDPGAPHPLPKLLVYREVVLLGPRQGTGKTALSLAVMTHRALAKWPNERSRTVYTAQTRAKARQKWEDTFVDAVGPAGSLIPKLQAKGLPVTSPTVREIGRWTGALIDTTDPAESWPPAPGPGAADRGGGGRPAAAVGGCVAWARRGPSVAISPLVAVTLAAGGHVKYAPLAGAGRGSTTCRCRWRPDRLTSRAGRRIVRVMTERVYRM